MPAIAKDDLSACNNYLIEQVISEQQTPENLYLACLESGIYLNQEQYGWLSEIALEPSIDIPRLKLIRQFLIDYEVKIINNQLDFAGLDKLLKSILIPEAEKELSLWEKFINWIDKNFLSHDEGDSEWIKNLIDMLAKLDIPDWLFTTLFRGAIVIILLLALYTIVNELRVAGIFKTKHHQKQKNPKDDSTQQYLELAETLDWQSIIQLPAKLQVSALLRYAIKSLTDKKLIPDNSSLTNLELYQYLLKTDANKSLLFSELYHGAELCLYGEICPDENDLGSMQINTRKLAGEFQTE